MEAVLLESPLSGPPRASLRKSSLISLGFDRKWYEFQKHRLQGALHVISTGSAGMRAVSTWA